MKARFHSKITLILCATEQANDYQKNRKSVALQQKIILIPTEYGLKAARRAPQFSKR